VNDWFVLEGKYLTNGNVAAAEGVSQQEAREADVYPSFWIAVDGRPLQVFCVMDFGYLRERDGLTQLVVTDLKTGTVTDPKKGPLKHELHKKQLAMYGIFIVEQQLGYSPEQIVLRLVYPQHAANERIYEYPFDQQSLFSAREQLLKDARRMFNCYLSIDHPEVAESNLTHTFPEYDARILWALGQYKREGSLPQGLDFQKILQFLKEKLSPFEWGLALRGKCEGVVAALEAVFARPNTSSLPDKEFFNSALLKELFPALGAAEILDAMSMQFMLVPLSERFRLAERVALERELPLGASHPVLADDPLNCLSCDFSWMCEVGEDAIRKAENRRNWSSLR
jgi:hypothetical protein